LYIFEYKFTVKQFNTRSHNVQIFLTHNTCSSDEPVTHAIDLAMLAAYSALTIFHRILLNKFQSHQKVWMNSQHLTNGIYDAK